MRQAPPVRFPVSYLHFSLALVISPAPKFTFHVVASVYRFSIHRLRDASSPSLSLPAPPAHDPPTSRRLYIASGEILLLEYGSPDRDESIREMPLARLERQSKRRSKYWPTIFYLFPMLRNASYFDKRADTRS